MASDRPYRRNLGDPSHTLFTQQSLVAVNAHPDEDRYRARKRVKRDPKQSGNKVQLYPGQDLTDEVMGIDVQDICLMRKRPDRKRSRNRRSGMDDGQPYVFSSLNGEFLEVGDGVAQGAAEGTAARKRMLEKAEGDFVFAGIATQGSEWDSKKPNANTGVVMQYGGVATTRNTGVSTLKAFQPVRWAFPSMEMAKRPTFDGIPDEKVLVAIEPVQSADSSLKGLRAEAAKPPADRTGLLGDIATALEGGDAGNVNGDTFEKVWVLLKEHSAQEYDRVIGITLEPALPGEQVGVLIR